jgi:aldose 1-epimerase
LFSTCRPRHAATVVDPSSGLQLELLTTSPAVQFYTGGFLGGDLPDTKGGCQYPRFGGFCLETQNFPDAVNQATFPTPILRPGQAYKQEIVYKFSVPFH